MLIVNNLNLNYNLNYNLNLDEMKQNDSDVTKRDLSYSIFVSFYLR